MRVCECVRVLASVCACMGACGCVWMCVSAFE